MKHLTYLLLLLLLGTSAFAQEKIPVAYVTRSNTDLQNHFLYAEVAYDVSSCGDYELRFRINRGGTTLVRRAKVQLLNNAENMVLAGDTSLNNIEAGGFRLRINLTGAAIAGAPGNDLSGAIDNADTLELCIDIFEKPVKCLDCDLPGDTATFTPQHDVLDSCPFGLLVNDENLLACKPRNNRQWEAFVRDPRTCAIYRVVNMPNKTWWMAQNLNSRKPGRCLNNATECKKDGTIYTWYEAISGEIDDPESIIFPIIVNNYTGPTGVCPPNWHIPTNQEWSALGMSLRSNADVDEIWIPGVLNQLTGFGDGSWLSSGGLRNAKDRYGFSWNATPFEAVKSGINGGSVKYGAFWSALDTAENVADSAVYRIAASERNGKWASSPLLVDSGKGSKYDRLPVRCVAGSGTSPELVSVPTPVIERVDSVVCRGDTTFILFDRELFADNCRYRVNGTEITPGVIAELHHFFTPISTVDLTVEFKAANSRGFWSKWSNLINVQVFRQGSIAGKPDDQCGNYDPGTIGQ